MYKSSRFRDINTCLGSIFRVQIIVLFTYLLNQTHTFNHMLAEIRGRSAGYNRLDTSTLYTEQNIMILNFPTYIIEQHAD